MPITPIKLFETSLGKIVDFSSMSSGDIFNKSAVSRVNEFDTMGYLAEGEAQREDQLQRGSAEELFQKGQSDDFLRGLSTPPIQGGSPMDLSRYEISLPTQEKDGAIKLSNYGYDSDTSPDYNSNVARIGHSNNKLEDGVSAALTPSLAKRYGIAKGDEFEAVTSDGKILRRRYDDTVPTHYRGKSLPETVDLFNLNGSNSFGGQVTDIRPLSKQN